MTANFVRFFEAVAEGDASNPHDFNAIAAETAVSKAFISSPGNGD